MARLLSLTLATTIVLVCVENAMARELLDTATTRSADLSIDNLEMTENDDLWMIV